jgi:hypothetical protein
MEDASAVDLDWFWRGWFYSTDNVDVSLEKVRYFQLNTNNPEIEKQALKDKDASKDQFIGDTRNKTLIEKTANENDPTLDDFYKKRNIYEVDALDRLEYDKFKNKLTHDESKLLAENNHFYELTFKNIGGLVTPLIVRFTYSDNTTEVVRIPAEIWVQGQDVVSKVFILKKEVVSVRVDPFLETADTDLNNNSWPIEIEPTRYQLFQQNKLNENPMQRQKRLEEIKK